MVIRHMSAMRLSTCKSMSIEGAAGHLTDEVVAFIARVLLCVMRTNVGAATLLAVVFLHSV